MSVDSEADLALAEKKDLARTLIRFKHRRLAARELNVIEDRIETQHEDEVASGSFTQIDLDTIGAGSLVKELPSAKNKSGATKRKPRTAGS